MTPRMADGIEGMAVNRARWRCQGQDHDRRAISFTVPKGKDSGFGAGSEGSIDSRRVRILPPEECC